MEKISRKQLLTIIGINLLVVMALITGGIFAYNAISNDKPSQLVMNNLEVSFMKQYGTSATINEMISPKIFEVAWKGSDGSQNVSINVGGVWCEIASIPVTTTTPAP